MLRGDVSIAVARSVLRYDGPKRAWENGIARQVFFLQSSIRHANSAVGAAVIGSDQRAERSNCRTNPIVT